MERNGLDGLYIPILANTNTYAPSKLKALYEEALACDPKIVALSIATRCDCLESEVLDYLEELNGRIPIWMELGLQTAHPETMEFLNLGYDLQTFQWAVHELNKRGIEVIAHIINGLPGETKEMMLETVKFINALPINGVKIHSLFIMKNTQLGKMYLEKPFPVLSLEEYAEIVSEQLALLREDIVIHRVSGVTAGRLPPLDKKKLVVMNEIDRECANWIIIRVNTNKVKPYFRLLRTESALHYRYCRRSNKVFVNVYNVITYVNVNAKSTEIS